MHDTIENLIPHRPPMLWIKALTGCTDKNFTATACFKEDDYCVADGKVIETALVECAAQTVAAVLGHRQQSGGEGKRDAGMGMLVAVSDFKVHSRPPVGRDVKIEIRERRQLGPMFMIAATISGDGEVFAEGNLSLYA
jgi:predicted hotdog family 3-hydroxylacyl-ACP dehydratase